MSNAFRITRLALTHFRSYAWLELTPGAASVALTGPNGTGKTNILEAISLLLPGRGLRKADLADVRQFTADEQQPWGVVAHVENGPERHTLGTARDASGETEKRAAQIDNNPAPLSHLSDHIALSWLTPEMDRLLADSPGDKRRFFDRLVAAFDPAHTGRLTRLEKQLRERVTLLQQPGSYDATWMATLEDELASTSVAIAAARQQLLAAINARAPQVAGQFPCLELRIKHGIELQLRDMPALTVEDNLRAAYARTRTRDAQSGSVEVGAHRTDIQAFYTAKNTPADVCSTGEQKALMITLLISHASLVREARGAAPILLLDEVASHLDSTRRQALFTALHALGCQVWMTGVESALFTGFPGPLATYQVGPGIAKKMLAMAG